MTGKTQVAPEVRKGFTLIELMIVISIVAILAVAGIVSFRGEGANDTVRMKTIKDAQVYLEDFRLKYGVYPNANNHSSKYPADSCSVSAYQGLVDCLVALGTIENGSDTYKRLATDPDSPQSNDAGEKYGYAYCVNEKGTKYRVAALAGKQDNKEYLGIDGNATTPGARYMYAVSPNTNPSDVPCSGGGTATTVSGDVSGGDTSGGDTSGGGDYAG